MTNEDSNLIALVESLGTLITKVTTGLGVVKIYPIDSSQTSSVPRGTFVRSVLLTSLTI